MEILKGFVFDIQRFALPDGGVTISDLKDMAGTFEAGKPLLIWNTTDPSGYKWAESNYATDDDKIGTGATTTDATGTFFSGFTLHKNVQTVIVDTDWKGVTITASDDGDAQAASVTTFKDNNDDDYVKHSFTVAETAGVIISGYDETNGYTLSGFEDDEITLTKGQFDVKVDGVTVAVQGGTDTVTVNGDTFKAGNANSYTYDKQDGSAIELGTSGVVTKSKGSDVTSVTISTAEFTTVSDTAATFENGAKPFIYNFSGGTVKTNGTGDTFTWLDEDDTIAGDIAFTTFNGTLTGNGAKIVPTIDMKGGTFTTGNDVKSVTVNEHTYNMTAAATFGYGGNEERVGAGTFTITSTISGRGTQEIIGATGDYSTQLSAVRATSGDVTVTIGDGEVKEITGLGAGETVKVYGKSTNDSDLVYTLSADSKSGVVT